MRTPRTITWNRREIPRIRLESTNDVIDDLVVLIALIVEGGSFGVVFVSKSVLLMILTLILVLASPRAVQTVPEGFPVRHGAFEGGCYERHGVARHGEDGRVENCGPDVCV